MASATILNTIVIAPGIDLRMTFTMYLPLIRSLLGTNAKMREGADCQCTNQSKLNWLERIVKCRKINKIALIVEKIVFVKNKEEGTL